MLPPRRVVLPFLGRFALILAVYLIPWRPIGVAYAALNAGIGNLIVGDEPHSGAVLHFTVPGAAEDDSSDPFRVELRAEKAETGAAVRIPIDTRTLSYIPTAVFLALSIAAPIWQGARGATVLLAGVGLLQIFLVSSIATPVLLFFAKPAPMHLVELGPILESVLDILYRALVAPPGMAYAIPGMLWLFMVWVVPARAPKAAVPTLFPT